MHLNLRQLRIFSAVADAGSLREAARRLHITQPAITHTMQELERSVGAQLIKRSAKGITLSDIGIALLRRARTVCNEVQRTEDEMAQLRDGVGGQLRIALSSAAAAFLLPRALPSFRAQRLGVALDLRELSWPEQDDRWQSGMYDFAVFNVLDEQALGDWEHERLLTRPLNVIARVGHPLAQAHSIVELQQSWWLVPGYGVEVLQRVFATKRKPPPNDISACQSWNVVSALVSSTDALTLLASDSHPCAVKLHDFIQLPIVEKLPEVHLSIVTRSFDALTPVAALFANCLRQVAAQAR